MCCWAVCCPVLWDVVYSGWSDTHHKGVALRFIGDGCDVGQLLVKRPGDPPGVQQLLQRSTCMRRRMCTGKQTEVPATSPTEKLPHILVLLLTAALALAAGIALCVAVLCIQVNGGMVAAVV